MPSGNRPRPRRSPATRLSPQAHGFEGLLLVVVVPQLHDLAIAKRRNHGIETGQFDAASPALGHHLEQRDGSVAPRRATLEVLDVPTLPDLIPAGEPLEKGIGPGCLWNVGVVDLDFGIELGHHGLIVLAATGLHHPAHQIDVLRRHRSPSIPGSARARQTTSITGANPWTTPMHMDVKTAMAPTPGPPRLGGPRPSLDTAAHERS